MADGVDRAQGLSELRAERPSGTVRGDTVAPPRRRIPGAYLAVLVGCAVGVLAICGLGLAALGRVGLEPPPQFSNNLCLDEKLEWLREHPGEAPTVLAVGSSVTWRNFDGDAVRDATGGRASVLNAAFCGLRMNQIAFTAEYFLARLPTVRDVITIVAPVDLVECSAVRTKVFDPADVDGYVYRQRWKYPYYLKYFDPLILAKNVWIIDRMQRGGFALDSVSFDRYGGAPLDTTASRPTLVYGALLPHDPQCLSALRDLARRVTADGKRLVVVMQPMSPAWIAQYDPDGTGLRRLTDEVRAALAGSSAVLWNPGVDAKLRAGQYIDAIHLRLSAARVFSRAIVDATDLGQEPSARITCCSIPPHS